MYHSCDTVPPAGIIRPVDQVITPRPTVPYGWAGWTCPMCHYEVPRPALVGGIASKPPPLVGNAATRPPPLPAPASAPLPPASIQGRRKGAPPQNRTRRVDALDSSRLGSRAAQVAQTTGDLNLLVSTPPSEISYPQLELVFPYATVFRAGFAVIHLESEPLHLRRTIPYGSEPLRGTIPYGSARPLTRRRTPRVLIIREKPRDPVKRAIGRYGVPKGRAELDEVFPIVTAKRELHEETGIDIDNLPPASYNILPTYVVFPRPEVGFLEVSVFFLVVMDTRPAITIDDEEIAGYQWVPIRNVPQDITSQMTMSSLLLMDVIKTMEF